MPALPPSLASLAAGRDGPDLLTLAVLYGTAAVIAAAVLREFRHFDPATRTVAAVRRHPVDTLSMTAAIAAVCTLVVRRVGVVATDPTTRLFLAVFGAVLAVGATVLHVAAKRELGRHWSDRIEILADHRIVTTGPYAVARHPMYGSLLLWLVGLACMAASWAALLATAAVFAPMVAVRARAEDRLLAAHDPAGFTAYAAAVSPLIPRFGDPASLGLRALVIAFLGYSVVARQTGADRIVFLSLAHVVAGQLSAVPKVRFSFVNKAFMMLLALGAAQRFPVAAWVYALVLLFDVWGLRSDCPCMLVYERYHGCPCFDLLRRALLPRRRTGASGPR